MKQWHLQAIYEKEEDIQFARVLTSLIRLLWGAYLFVLFIGLYYSDREVIATALAGCVLQILPMEFLRRGYLKASNFILIVNVLVTLTAIATFGQGIRDLSLLAFPIIFIFAGLTLNRAVFRFFVGLTLMAMSWLIFGEANGWFIPKPYEGTPSWINFLIVSIIVLATAMVADLLARNIRGNLENAQQEIAQRKQAEKALLESEERFKLSMDATNDGLWDWNIKTDGGYFSPNYYRMLGYKIDDFPMGGNVWKEMIHPDDQERTIRVNMDCVEGLCDQFEVEYRMKTKGGEWRWILGRGKCIARNEHGRATRLVGTHVDITERKLAEAALQESAAQFRNIIDLSPIPYALNDEEQNITYLNNAFTKTFGYELKDIPTLEDWWRRAYPDPDYRRWVNETWQSNLDKAKTEGTEFEPIELNIRSKDGSVKTVLVSAGLLTESFQGIHLVILYDITERKQAENELFQQKSLLGTIIDSIPEAIFAKDTAGKYVIVNEFGARVIGYNVADMIGHTDMELLPAETAREFRKTDEYTMSSGQVYKREENGMINGKPSIFLAHKTPWRNSSGEIIGVIGISIDITERKQTEKQLRYQSTHDALTGIYNRAFFETELARLEHSREFPVSIVIADVDKLKNTNDIRGHAAGDDLLRRVAHILGSVFREGDILARIGGDEFAVLLPTTNTATAEQMLARVKEQLTKHNIEHPDLPVQLSIGTATAMKNNLTKTFTLADQRMYADKSIRKSKVDDNLPSEIN